VITSLFGAGVLLALSPATPPGLGELLFGDVLAASNADLALAGGLAVAVLLGMWLAHWRLLAAGFDPLGARALGVHPLSTEVVLLMLLAAAVLVGVQALGNLLVVAALIAPAAAARLLTRRASRMILAAAAIGVGCGIAGLYLSYYAAIAAGASIAGTLLAAVALAAALRLAR
jgi:ABC-type Mn2+/Zn2+ transport system permease subunit